MKKRPKLSLIFDEEKRKYGLYFPTFELLENILLDFEKESLNVKKRDVKQQKNN